MGVLSFKLNDANALKLLRKIAQNSSNVKFNSHATQQMRKRKITPVQVINCLLKGTISESACVDPHGRWKLTLERQAGGEHIGVAVSIDDDALVITAFHRGKRL